MVHIAHIISDYAAAGAEIVDNVDIVDTPF
jgi:hypothetical protein